MSESLLNLLPNVRHAVSFVELTFDMSILPLLLDLDIPDLISFLKETIQEVQQENKVSSVFPYEEILLEMEHPDFRSYLKVKRLRYVIMLRNTPNAYRN